MHLEKEIMVCEETNARISTANDSKTSTPSGCTEPVALSPPSYAKLFDELTARFREQRHSREEMRVWFLEALDDATRRRSFAPTNAVANSTAQNAQRRQAGNAHCPIAAAPLLRQFCSNTILARVNALCVSR
ncbi:hypothetical protein PRIPAC_70263 [Pristionchus pacificus]|uniref:Uncharacterized protein n=1 Tax=Pristionchus pacificus TaxID=54126 RepID=A0A2A6C5L7_PRIPA|nr:hypothetical protein PRIPAC_70263 [Pristionchus pacificus]|eukprot:PDM73454.1 hypothetical protein PRIPAC_40810 [Pristionchus pacificus]